MLETREFAPTHSFHLVELTETEKVLPSGIILADSAVPENYSHGRIVASGPGRVYDNGRRSMMDGQPGDDVMFPREAFHALEGQTDRGLGYVRDEDLVAFDLGDDHLTPANDWVLLDLDAAQRATHGGIAIPGQFLARPTSGRIRKQGPGAVQAHGRLEAVRVQTPVPAEGTRVWWSAAAECYDSVTPQGRQGTFVRAGDLLVEEVNP